MSRQLLAPLVPLPLLTTVAPPRPPEAAAEPITTSPLFPDAADPELNRRHPLDPAAPELPLWTASRPLLVPEPAPEATAAAPPLRPLLLAESSPIPFP